MTSGITQLFAGVAVTDFDAARGWYERLFGRPLDVVPREGEACAGKGLLSLAVDDLEALAELNERGLPT